MKIKGIIILLASVFITTTGCSKNRDEDKPRISIEKSTSEKIQEKLKDMESYASNATITYVSNKGSNVYETMQQSKVSGEYKIEILAPENAQGNVTICDGKTITQYNKKVAGKIAVNITENMERSELFLTSFLRNYENSEETSVGVLSLNEGECTVLEAIIPNDHPYMKTEKLWVNNNTLEPVKLVIYDSAGTERIITDYTNFEYNVTLPDEVFTIPSI